MKMIKIPGGGHKGNCQILCFAQNFGRNLNPFTQSKNKIKAFTLAEVLITLAIIGVVAALTIPTVIQNYQKKMYVTQLKKSYNNLTNGFKTYMAQEGVTKMSDTTLWTKIPNDGSASGIVSVDLLDESNKELKDEFLKIFKVTGFYNPENFPENQKFIIKDLSGEEAQDINFGVFLADGSWLYFEFAGVPYRTKCGDKECSSLKEFQEIRNTPTKLWEGVGYIAIDVNGLNGPNTWGRDIFDFYLSNDGTLYPRGGKEYAIFGEGGDDCSYNNLSTCSYYWETNGNCSKETTGGECAARIMEEGWKMDY